MLRFQFQCAWLAIRRFPGLSSLIVCAIALGLAATMSTAVIVWRLGADPIPNKSKQLHYVMLDTWAPDGYRNDFSPPDQLTHMDAMALFDKAPALKQAPMYRIGLAVQPERAEIAPTMENGRATSRHFLEMFEFPILEGATWAASDDANGSAVVLISEALKKKLFGAQSALGKELTASNIRFKIIGVYATPKRLVKIHDLTNGPFEHPEEFVVPLRTAIRLHLESRGNNNCWKPFDGGWEGWLTSECIWLQYWVQLDTANARQQYQSYLDSYAEQQHKLGRFPRTTKNNLLVNATEHMVRQRVVSDDQRMSSWVGLGFLLVALVNAICLMLAKFLRSAHTAAVHRALGAARSQIFRLHLIEAMMLGVISAILGLACTWLALWGMRWANAELIEIAWMDWRVMLCLLGVSLLCTALAGALPAWRVSRLAPAASLRTQ
jgi:putative ABC transport system permease protein